VNSKSNRTEKVGCVLIMYSLPVVCYSSCGAGVVLWLPVGQTDNILPLLVPLLFTEYESTLQYAVSHISITHVYWSVTQTTNKPSQLNSTEVYLKAVAERLKKIQCSARTNNFKNTIKQTQYKNWTINCCIFLYN